MYNDTESGFIRAEIDLMSQGHVPQGSTDSDASSSSAAPPGIVRGAAPTHISLAPIEGRRLRSASDLSNVMRTPGSRPVGAPALTPAVPVDASSATPTTPQARTVSHKMVFIKDHALSPIPASPIPPGTPGASVTRTPSTVGKEPGDYFGGAGGRGRRRSGSVVTDNQDELPVGPGNSGPQTPGGGFMGRLRNFGKSSKRPSSVDATAAPIPEDRDNASSQPADTANSSIRTVRRPLLAAYCPTYPPHHIATFEGAK